MWVGWLWGNRQSELCGVVNNDLQHDSRIIEPIGILYERMWSVTGFLVIPCGMSQSLRAQVGLPDCRFNRLLSMTMTHQRVNSLVELESIQTKFSFVQILPDASLIPSLEDASLDTQSCDHCENVHTREIIEHAVSSPVNLA